MRILSTFLSIIISIAGISACTSQKVEPAAVVSTGPDYSRALSPGQGALRLVIDPSRMPDIAAAYHGADSMLYDAIDQSLIWFTAPSSRRYFPAQGITHERAEASVLAIKDQLLSAVDASTFVGEMQRLFDVYESVGYDGRGTVLFTGYFSPQFRASRRQSRNYPVALYQRPADLVTDPLTGKPRGRKMFDGSIETWPTREKIERSGMLKGTELVWLTDALSAYIVHVNGSAKLRLTDDSIMYVGYAGKTDRPYASLGKAMVEAGMLKSEVTLSAIKTVFQQQPQRVRELMNHNENYVFFTEYDGGNWPAGSLGVPVTTERTLATDKNIYPRGGMVLVDTKAVTFSHDRREFLQFMLDQDTGGAIQAPGRADIFMGIGPGAEILAGGQYAEGKLYYFFLKPEYVSLYSTENVVTQPTQ